MKPLSETHSAGFYINFDELCLSANISQQTICELIDHNILVPFAGAQPQQWQFHVSCVMQAKKALRLYRDLDMDWSDLALVLNLLEEIDRLKNENGQLMQQLGRFFHAPNQLGYHQ